MNKLITRNYLDISSIAHLNEVKRPINSPSLKVKKIDDFQLNKFFYKQIGKNHQWLDRLEWTEQNWIDYVSNKKLLTFILKNNDELIGYFELILHSKEKEVEIAYFGILAEYRGKKLGGHLLSEAIKKSFLLKAKRVWAHTCTFDHQNALKNYIARGMNIFKQEELIAQKL